MKIAGPISDREAELLERIHKLTMERNALSAFKKWVHDWLDNVGVPYDPDPKHTEETKCRISGRMRWLLTYRPNVVTEYKTDNPAT